MSQELTSLSASLQSLLPADICVSDFSATITLLSRLEGVASGGAEIAGCFGPFQVLRALGEGGMGVVLLVKDTRDDKVVAAKVLKPALLAHSLAVQRFTSEAQHMSRLKHPHILPVLECGQSVLGPYYLMPHCDAGSLAEELKAGKPLSRERILEVLLPVAEALAHAHQRGLIHRDLKPGNILMTGQGEVYLSDFGLARTLFNERTLNVEGSHCEGTAPYLSPAVASGQAEDTRCDIYSFGAILYQMLTGRFPYQGKDAEEIIGKIKAGPPRPVLEVNPKAPLDLVVVCEAAMARDQRDRYANMEDLLRDLRLVKEGKTPMGTRSRMSWLNRGRLWWRRHGVKVAVGMLMGVAVLGAWRLGWFRGPEFKLVRTLKFEDGFHIGPSAVGYWNKDKILDFFSWNSVAGTVDIVDANGNRLQRIIKDNYLSVNEPLSSIHVERWDITGDGADELFVFFTLRGPIGARVVNPKGYVLRKFDYEGEYVPASSKWGETSTYMVFGCWSDLDGDNHPEFVANYKTAFGKERPRGLCVFDGNSGSLRWDFPTAPFVNNVIAEDLDEDGRREVICGTFAPNNGKKLADGTDDASSTVIVLEADGRLRWRRTTGGISTYTSVVKLPGWPGGRVYAVVMANYLARQRLVAENTIAPEIAGRVMCFDASGTVLHDYRPPYELHHWHTADVNGDGRHEILISDTNGWVRVLDGDLKVVSERQITRTRHTISMVKILGNARLPLLKNGPHVLVLSMDKEVEALEPIGNDMHEIGSYKYHDIQAVVLDRFFSPVVHSPLQISMNPFHTDIIAETKDVDGDGVDEILVFTGPVNIWKLTKE